MFAFCTQECLGPSDARGRCYASRTPSVQDRRWSVRVLCTIYLREGEGGKQSPNCWQFRPRGAFLPFKVWNAKVAQQGWACTDQRRQVCDILLLPYSCINASCCRGFGRFRVQSSAARSVTRGLACARLHAVVAVLPSQHERVQ